MTDLGFQFGYPIWFTAIGITGFVMIGVTAWTIKFVRNRGDWVDRGGALIMALIFVPMVFLGCAISFLASNYPYNPYYWHIYAVSGTVEKVTAAVQADGKYVTNQYTVRLSGHNQLFTLTNPRIAQYAGSNIDLICSPNYVYLGTDQWTCDIRSINS